MTQFTRDQDVFETPDVTEETFNYDDDQKSAAIEKLQVNVKSSYNRFQGKTLDAKDIDFSDTVNRRVQCGFRVQPSEYEGVSCSHGDETVMERYLRLKEEVGELISDVEKIKETQQDSEKLLQVSPTALLQDVQVLQKQLHGLQLDSVLGTDMMTSPDHPYQAVLMRDLKAQVHALKAPGEGEGQERGTTAGGQPLYEIYTRTETAKFAHLSKLSEVERRLSQLEALVGNEETTVTTVTGGLDSKDKDLSSAVFTLQARVALLDPDHVATIASQLQDVLSLLDQVNSQTESKPEDPDRAAKVTKALETVGRLGSVASLIPDLVERLHALRELHERAGQFAGAVAYIADGQDQLSKQTSELQSLLQQVQVSLQQNMTTLHSEFSEIGTRMSQLKTKS